jgi:hypothetical protein
VKGVAKSLDVHPTGGLSEDKLKKMQNKLPHEFGVTRENIMYNFEDDKVFCLIEAPDKNAVEKHPSKYGVKCEWIVEGRATSD